MLGAVYTPKFKKDIKRLDKKHISDEPLVEVINLIIENSLQSKRILR